MANIVYYQFHKYAIGIITKLNEHLFKRNSYSASLFLCHASGMHCNASLTTVLIAVRYCRAELLLLIRLQIQLICALDFFLSARHLLAISFMSTGRCVNWDARGVGGRCP